MSKFQDVRVQLNLYNMTISSNRTSGEYRVNFKGGTEDTAYYTNDLEDALETGLAMRKAEREHGQVKSRKPKTGSAAEDLQQLDIEDVKNSAALLPIITIDF